MIFKSHEFGLLKVWGIFRGLHINVQIVLGPCSPVSAWWYSVMQIMNSTSGASLSCTPLFKAPTTYVTMSFSLTAAAAPYKHTISRANGADCFDTITFAQRKFRTRNTSRKRDTCLYFSSDYSSLRDASWRQLSDHKRPTFSTVIDC